MTIFSRAKIFFVVVFTGLFHPQYNYGSKSLYLIFPIQREVHLIFTLVSKVPMTQCIKVWGHRLSISLSPQVFTEHLLSATPVLGRHLHRHQHLQRAPAPCWCLLWNRYAHTRSHATRRQDVPQEARCVKCEETFIHSFTHLSSFYRMSALCWAQGSKGGHSNEGGKFP